MRNNEFPITTGSIQYMKSYSCQSMRVLACRPLDRKRKCVTSNRPMLSSVWGLSKVTTQFWSFSSSDYQRRFVPRINNAALGTTVIMVVLIPRF
jgi:hypothetical protein